MDAIYIPRLLKLRERQEEIRFQESISCLETLTPVKGHLLIRHGGNFLEVIVQAEAIVTLTCDRCLQHYNHRLTIDTSEIIWLAATANFEDLPTEREVSLEDLAETLPPNGYFDTEAWLYEQFSLATPLRKICGADCQGIEQTSSVIEANNIDHRWSSLASLKEQLKSQGNNK